MSFVPNKCREFVFALQFLNSKAWRVIKWTGILLFACCLHVSAHSYSQQITINANKQPLKTVLKTIEKQSGYFFIYQQNLLKDAPEVTLHINNLSFREALAVCFKKLPYSYTIVEKTIVLKRKENSSTNAQKPETTIVFIPQLQTVTGSVTDSAGMPLSNVSVFVKGTKNGTTTDNNGRFTLSKMDVSTSIIVFKHLNYKDVEIKLNGRVILTIKMYLSISELEETVVSTGYQTIPKERATGSFDVINNELLNRSVSTNILDRLNGVTSGMLFNNIDANPQVNLIGFDDNQLGIKIRGQSTIYANVNPLIILDNFPYDGDIRNINPNDIESVTVLKDAAAASIWGARSGNGVIVITTKKGKLNQKMKVDFNSSLTIVNKPDLMKDQNFMSPKDYIEVEEYLFDKGFFNNDLSNTFSWPAISPAVEIFSARRDGLISANEAEQQLSILRKVDVRKDIQRYIYQKAINQQYSLGLRGGTQDMTYQLSVGIDKNKDNLVNNGLQRLTVNSLNTYRPIKNLELTAAINYSQTRHENNNEFNYSTGSAYSLRNNLYNSVAIIPYLQLADKNGNPLVIPRSLRNSYIQSTVDKGFLDWNYRPLDEIKNANNTTKINDLLLRASAKYSIIPTLKAEVQYQYERQIIETRRTYNENTYLNRDLINRYLEYDPESKEISYIIPTGDVLQNGNYNWQIFNLRGQLTFNKKIKKGELDAIAGAEIRQKETAGYNWGSYGYDENFGTGSASFNYEKFYPTNPSGSARIPGTGGGSISGTMYRYISYFTNAAYTFDRKYTVSVSGRKDGSNIFGAKTNDKITPLWSAGIAWNINNEPFYNLSWLPYAKLRLTYGFNGNVYNGSAYLSGSYTASPYGNLPIIIINNAPNPQLSWERVKNLNLGLDFATTDNQLTGTIEIYRKEGLDLIEPTPQASQTGFTTYNGNTASTLTNGIDISLNVQDIKTRNFRWNTILLLSFMHDELKKYEIKQTSNSLQDYTTGIIGKPLHSIYSYKWAGLNPENGNPQGYLNGSVSDDYSGIINNFQPDSLIYHGSSIPTKYGSLRNDIWFKGFTLSFNILFKFGYFIRRGSIDPNYSFILSDGPNIDYEKRWQKPNDNTDVPSLVYPSDNNRSRFYNYSSVLVESGSHIRLQDIRLSYDFNTLTKNKIIRRLEVYAFANNIGIIWRKNKHDIDPEFYSPGSHFIPTPFALSFGITANL